MNWNDLAKEVHRDAVDKGEWDKPRTLDDVICDCLVHLSNAYTAWKDGRPNVYHLCQPSGEKEHICDLGCGGTCSIAHGDPCEYRGNKPQGVAVELADCVLRLLDYLATTNADIDGAFRVATQANTDEVKNEGVINVLLDSAEELLAVRRVNPSLDFDEIRNNGLIAAVIYIVFWASAHGIDLESILREKHECNKTRPYRHGGKKL